MIERVGGTNGPMKKELNGRVLQRISSKAIKQAQYIRGKLNTINPFRQSQTASILKYKWVVIAVLFVIVGLGSLNNRTVNETYQSSSPNPALNQPTRNYNTLPNGTVINSPIKGGTGLGRLKIDNGTSGDAVTKLVNKRFGISMFTVYIKAESQYTITGISDGVYDLYFQTGRDWEDAKSKFLVSPSFSKFRDNFTFNTTETENYDGIYTNYATYTVTLNPVISGNAKTDTVAEAEFAKY